MVVVQWSPSMPSTPKKLVQIPLDTEFFSTVLREDKNKFKKEAGLSPFLKKREVEIIEHQLFFGSLGSWQKLDYNKGSFPPEDR